MTVGTTTTVKYTLQLMDSTHIPISGARVQAEGRDRRETLDVLSDREGLCRLDLGWATQGAGFGWGHQPFASGGGDYFRFTITISKEGFITRVVELDRSSFAGLGDDLFQRAEGLELRKSDKK
jgi:hypothetical protein